MFLAGAVAWVAACSPGLENYSDATDLRVLGIQAEPPEILADQPVSLDTNVSALVVDPRGGPLQYTWSLCPVQSSLACDDFASLTQTLDPNTQSVLQSLRAIQQSGTVEPTVADANTPSSYPIPAFNPRVASIALYGTDITKAVYAYQYTYATLLNFGLGAWPVAILTLTSSHGDSLTATKRMVIGIADYNSIAAPFAQYAGVPLCTAAASPPNCISLAAKIANRNPNITSVSMSPGLAGNGVWSPVLNRLILDANTQVRLRPNSDAGSQQTYQTLRGTLQGGGIEVETVTELLSVSWFYTEGAIENNLTQPLLQPTLENVYTSPTTFSGAPVALWLVMRDQRGGESWRGIVITPGL
jgi:hypothetical protein